MTYLYPRLNAIVKVWHSNDERAKKSLNDTQKQILQEYLGCKEHYNNENCPKSVMKDQFATKEELQEISNRLKRVEGVITETNLNEIINQNQNKNNKYN